MTMKSEAILYSVMSVCALIFLCFLVQECNSSEYEVCKGAADPSSCIEALSESIQELYSAHVGESDLYFQCRTMSSSTARNNCIRQVINSNLATARYDNCDCICPAGYGNNQFSNMSEESEYTNGH